MKQRRRSYWPRYFAVTDSGFSTSSKDVGPATKSAANMRRAGWHTIVIHANSREDADRKAQPHWNYCRELNRKESAS